MRRSDENGCAAVIGPGAIGGLLAADLTRAGRKVLRIGRSDSAAPDRRGACAAVFLCVKAGAVRSAAAKAKKLLSDGAPVVAMQNGLSHVPLLRKAFGPERLVFASCYVAALRDSSGRSRRTGGGGVLLARNGRNARALAAARDWLAAAGWRPRAAASEDRMLWTKTVYNAAVNPIGALARKTNAELAEIPALRQLLEETVREGADIARRAGFPLPDADPAARVVRGCRAAPGQYNSMLQDIEAGRPTEADAILKPLIDAARRRGRSTRYLEPLYRMIKALEKTE